MLRRTISCNFAFLVSRLCRLYVPVEYKLSDFPYCFCFSRLIELTESRSTTLSASPLLPCARPKLSTSPILPPLLSSHLSSPWPALRLSSPLLSSFPVGTRTSLSLPPACVPLSPSVQIEIRRGDLICIAISLFTVCLNRYSFDLLSDKSRVLLSEKRWWKGIWRSCLCPLCLSSRDRSILLPSNPPWIRIL